MRIMISSMFYPLDDFSQMIELLKLLGSQSVGIEIFPLWHLTRYERILEQYLDDLSAVPVTFHCPYHGTDPCFPPQDPEHEVFLKYYRLTMKYSRLLDASYIVHHYYNWDFSPDERDGKFHNSANTLKILEEMAQQHELKLAIENTEISKSGRNMFTEDGFIDMAKSSKHPVLIDLGHVSCAGWNLVNLIRALADKIVGYHLHNNDGIRDSHQRILDGVVDMETFFEAYSRFTPDADLTFEYPPGRASLAEIQEDIRYIRHRVKEYGA